MMQAMSSSCRLSCQRVENFTFHLGGLWSHFFFFFFWNHHVNHVRHPYPCPHPFHPQVGEVCHHSDQGLGRYACQPRVGGEVGQQWVSSPPPPAADQCRHAAGMQAFVFLATNCFRYLAAETFHVRGFALINWDFRRRWWKKKKGCEPGCSHSRAR